MYVYEPMPNLNNKLNLYFVVVGRDRRYLDLSLQFTVNTVLTSFTLNLLPKFLKPYVHMHWHTQMH
jgi:hypothetical protein